MSNEAFLAAWLETKREEAGYVNDPLDSGGETNHGITVGVARANGYDGDMRDLSSEQARAIAKTQYWDLLRLDDIAQHSPTVARELFDSGILVGQARVARWFQRLLNVSLPESPVEVDGLIGPITVRAFTRLLARRAASGELVILLALNGFLSVHCTELAERREKDERYWFGWHINRVQIKEGQAP